MTGTQTIQLAAAVLLLAGNFFFVAVEFSVTRARPTMVTDLVSRGARGSGSLQHAVRHIDAYLSACQLGITVCSIGLGITAEPVVSHALASVFGGGSVLGISAAALGFVAGYAIVSTFHVVLGELAPKSLAIARTEGMGLRLAPPMRLFYLLTKPAVDLLNWMGNIVLKPFGIPAASEASEAPHSETELQTLMGQSEREGMLGSQEKAFAEAAFTFGDRRAREVMVPRSNVSVLANDQTVQDAAQVAVRCGHNRLPLCESGEGLDQATSVVRVISLLEALTLDGDTKLADVGTPLLRASEVVLLDELLADMRKQQRHMALLTDEYGTAVGIVTMEDVLEQIVGDIRDETDNQQERAIERRPDGSIRVSGRTAVDAVRRELGLRLDDHRQATFGGYLIEQAGRVPARGEIVPLQGWQAVVDERDDTTITATILHPDQEPGAESDEDAGRDPSRDIGS